MKFLSENLLWTLLRLSLSFIFLWAFFDKVFGLGFSTTPDKSWFAGISPTAGFLKFGATGILGPFFSKLSGNLLIDILFMGGLFFVGFCLLLGIASKLTSFFGSLMMFLIYLSLVPSANNPLIDEHIIYILVFLLLAQKSEAQMLTLSKSWQKLSFVKKFPLLK